MWLNFFCCCCWYQKLYKKVITTQTSAHYKETKSFNWFGKGSFAMLCSKTAGLIMLSCTVRCSAILFSWTFWPKWQMKTVISVPLKCMICTYGMRCAIWYQIMHMVPNRTKHHILRICFNSLNFLNKWTIFWNSNMLFQQYRSCGQNPTRGAASCCSLMFILK